MAGPSRNDDAPTVPDILWAWASDTHNVTYRRHRYVLSLTHLHDDQFEVTLEHLHRPGVEAETITALLTELAIEPVALAAHKEDDHG